MSENLEEKAEDIFNSKKSILEYLVESYGRIGAGESTKQKVKRLLK